MTKTTTTDSGLKWRRDSGIYAGVVAKYGDFIFCVFAWKHGSYIAAVHDTTTRSGYIHRTGSVAGQVTTERQGKEICHQWFRELRDQDRKAGISRR